MAHYDCSYCGENGTSECCFPQYMFSKKWEAECAAKKAAKEAICDKYKKEMDDLAYMLNTQFMRINVKVAYKLFFNRK